MMERRAFVRLSAYTALVLTLPLAQGCISGSKEMDVAQPLLFSHLIDVNGIKEAGLAYRQAHKLEDDQQKLTQLLLGGKDIASVNKKEVRNMLNEQVIADFTSGNTLLVKGWVLSITEARQCALFSILKS
jgi:hypothetical protein